MPTWTLLTLVRIRVKRPETVQLIGSLLLMLAFALVFAGVFLPWISNQPSAFYFEGYEVDYYGIILIISLIGLAIGVVTQKRLVSSIIGGLVLTVTLVAAITWQSVLSWACFKAYGIALVVCEFQGYGLGFILTMTGAILTLVIGLTFWYLERSKIRGDASAGTAT